MSIVSNEHWIVAEEETGKRLDKLLTERFAQHSRTYFQFLIENGSVLVNGQRIKKREQPKLGDEIEICFLLTPEISLEAENIPLDILYEDEHILAVNKPAGMVVHPAAGHYSQTFVNALLYHCKHLQGSSDNLRPGIVHRLDKDTTGVLLAAKTTEAHQKLISLFCERRIEKHYLAVCIGCPGDVTIDEPIGRHPVRRKEMAISPEGKEAISRCRTIKKNGDLSLVEVQLITGRTHQIRVHLKSRKTPVLGDPVYGSMSSNEKYKVFRQLLHAHRVCFTHPITGMKVELIAPIPDDMSTIIKKNLSFESGI